MSPDISNRQDLLDAYTRFQQDETQQFRVNVRRNRSAFIREFMSREAIDPDEFNREVWIFESGTRVAGRDIKGQIPTTGPMSDELLQELKHAMASGTLELHGNYTWGSGSGVYSPSIKDKDVLRANLQIARRILISAEPPSEKAKRLNMEVDGFGSNISTGLVMMFHPKEFAIYNQASQTATRLLGIPMDTLEAFQDSVRQLKKMLGCADFLELDWFLYLLQEGYYPDALPFSRKIQTWRKDHCTTERISYREGKEREALRVLQGGAEALTREQLERVLDLLNADFFKGKESSRRFGLALTGNNRVNLIENIASVNEWIRRFLSAKASQVSTLISEFLKDHPPGAGIAFASLMLYLRNPQKYSIWLPAMIKGVNSLTNAGFTERSGRAYLSYNDEVQRLRKIFNLAPQEPDILFSIDETPVNEGKKGGIEEQYWWLNANPSIWSLDAIGIGERETYTAVNEKGNKRQKYKSFEEVKPGDLVIGYMASPLREITAMCRITKALHDHPNGPSIEFEKTQEFLNPVSYGDLKRIPELAQAEPLRNNQGSLFKLAKEEFDIIRDLLDTANLPPSPASEQYSVQDALRELFISDVDFEKLRTALLYKKNVILQGPPGVGKTFMAKRLAYAILEKKDERRVEMIQFHQSYSY
jgi:hypothetical protein